MCWLDYLKKKSAVWTDKRDKILGLNNILLEKVFGRKKSWMENFVSEKVFGLKNVGRFLVVTPFFLHISSSWVKIWLHSKNHLPRWSGSALKDSVVEVGWVPLDYVVIPTSAEVGL